MRAYNVSRANLLQAAGQTYAQIQRREPRGAMRQLPRAAQVYVAAIIAIACTVVGLLAVR